MGWSDMVRRWRVLLCGGVVAWVLSSPLYFLLGWGKFGFGVDALIFGLVVGFGCGVGTVAGIVLANLFCVWMWGGFEF